MVEITHPLNKDGVIYDVGHILSLGVENENALIESGFAKSIEKQEEIKPKTKVKK